MATAEDLPSDVFLDRITKHLQQDKGFDFVSASD
jgi:hypothetical protein